MYLQQQQQQQGSSCKGKQNAQATMLLSDVSLKTTVNTAVNTVVMNDGGLTASGTGEMWMVMRIGMGFNLLNHWMPRQ
jgi:hypothetical protein